jgi:hypothetical protein
MCRCQPRHQPRRAGNLSSGNDAWTNREFSIDGSGTITYSGTHARASQLS